MTTYKIAFTNRFGKSQVFNLDNLFDLRNFIFDNELKAVTVGKIVDDVVVYFACYEDGKRVRKIEANTPLIK